jgi:pantetheine-phosphate adenylyltransferase
MSKIAVFPGSFDPITSGHVDIVHRALPLFDKIIVAIGINNHKRALFPLEHRIQWLKEVFHEDPKVEVGQFTGLTAHYAHEIGAGYLLRGLRNASDFDYEKTISQLNQIVGKVWRPCSSSASPLIPTSAPPSCGKSSKAGETQGPSCPTKSMKASRISSCKNEPLQRLK